MGETDNPQGEIETPEGNEGQTPKESPTFTPEQVSAAVAKAKSDTLTDYKRLEAEFKRSQSVAEAALKRLKTIEEENYRREEEMVRNDPDELSRVRRRRQDAEREARLEEREAKIQTQLDRVLQSTARDLSKQYNVTEETLRKYGGGDAESIEELAKSYGERGNSTTKRMTESPDPGRTKDLGADLTAADLEKMSPEERNRRSSEIAKLPLLRT